MSDQFISNNYRTEIGMLLKNNPIPICKTDVSITYPAVVSTV